MKGGDSAFPGPLVALTKILVLPKWWHRERNVISSRSHSDSTRAGVRWSRANRPRTLTLGRPEHIAQHPRRTPSAIRHHTPHIASRAVLQRSAEVCALRSRVPASHDVHASCELRRRNWRNRRTVLWLAINMLLPVGLRPRTCWAAYSAPWHWHNPTPVLRSAASCCSPSG